jgi:endonuclease/exonuclease/phosphatase family metal-dependent hydrolase
VDAGTLTVMTYNVMGHGAFGRESHVDEVARTIVEVSPDVVALQEIHRFTDRARGLDQLALLEAATGMKAAFGRSFKHGEKAEYGNALLTRGAIEEEEILPLPGKGEPRTILRTTIRNGSTHANVFVTHLTAWWIFGRRTRRLQAKRVAEIVRASKLPFILLGDFNTTPKSAELREFHDGALVTSCFTPGVVTHRLSHSCLDYIFVSPHWQVTSSRVVPAGPSDHWPLVATLVAKSESRNQKSENDEQSRKSEGDLSSPIGSSR